MRNIYALSIKNGTDNAVRIVMKRKGKDILTIISKLAPRRTTRIKYARKSAGKIVEAVTKVYFYKETEKIPLTEVKEIPANFIAQFAVPEDGKYIFKAKKDEAGKINYEFYGAPKSKKGPATHYYKVIGGSFEAKPSLIVGG
jgi:hypothetical protein